MSSIGVLANQLGTAIGFLLSSQLVRVPDDLPMLLLVEALFCSVVFLAAAAVVRAAPPIAPSSAVERASLRDATSLRDYARSVWWLLRNGPFRLLLVAYGIAVGVFYAVTTLLAQLLLDRFPGHDVRRDGAAPRRSGASPHPHRQDDYGWIGFVIVIVGLAGLLLGGLLLDRTGRFKMLTGGAFVCAAGAMAGLAVAVGHASLAAIYATAGVFGFFISALLGLGFEFAAELSYPAREQTSAGLLNCSAQLFGILFIQAGQPMIEHVGVDALTWMLCGALCVGACFALVVREHLLRRQIDDATTTVPWSGVS